MSEANIPSPGLGTVAGRGTVGGVYARLGIEPVVNAAATFTAIGGSRMPPEVLEAMAQAAGAFVDMHELHLAVGRRLAELTRNEAAYVTSGCAAGIALAVLAARNAGDPRRITQLAGTSQGPCEVAMHAAHRIPYDPAIQLAGGRIRQFGNTLQTLDWELEAAITEETVAVFYVAGTHVPQTALPLREVLRIAHGRGVPVIVDAAAQLPPVENLWRFTRDEGADLALFSGGKGLRGPQASGLMVGRADLVEAARQNGSPFQRWGRAFKAGKEEIIGLLAAVERFVAGEHAAERARCRRMVEAWARAVDGIAGVTPRIEDINEAGQDLPRLHLGVTGAGRAGAVLAHFDSVRPRLAVYPDRANGLARGFWITPELLEGDEAAYVEHTVLDALATTAAPGDS